MSSVGGARWRKGHPHSQYSCLVVELGAISIDPIVIKLGAACNWASEALIPVGELEAESSFSEWMTG